MDRRFHGRYNRHALVFTEVQRGKTVYVAVCRQNRKGQRGARREIESAVVPQNERSRVPIHRARQFGYGRFKKIAYVAFT
ncbi:MAG: hypothetical protein LBP64_03335 [Tannerella sp.]|nr:hypothetical protein [Tannerella sp.]